MAMLPARMRCPYRLYSRGPSLGMVSRFTPSFAIYSRCSYAHSSKGLTSSGESPEGLYEKSRPFVAEQQQTAPTPLQQLAARITAHADALAAQTTSVSEAGRRTSVNVVVEQTRLRDALTEALILATDAKDFVPELAARNNQFASIRWLCHFRIPEALPLTTQTEGSLSEESPFEHGKGSLPTLPAVPYSTIAQQTGVPLHQLRSIARMAMLTGFLSEPKPEHVAHSSLSAAMVKQPDLLEWARFVTSTSAPMVANMVEATERWGGDLSISKTAYGAAWKTDLPLFAHVAANPDLQARYAAYMRVMMQSEGMALHHLVEGWQEGWSALAARKAVLVDVGGSRGHVSIGIVRRFPGMKVVVQDRESVVTEAHSSLASSLEAWGVKLAFQGHDFFLPQPIRPQGYENETQGDVYLLRQILHDWDDENCCKILRNLAAALEAAGPRGRLIVMDTMLPNPGQVSHSEEALLRVRDLTMQQAHNTHERNRAEWTELFRMAHPKLKIQQITQPRGSLMAIIEVGME